MQRRPVPRRAWASSTRTTQPSLFCNNPGDMLLAHAPTSLTAPRRSAMSGRAVVAPRATAPRRTHAARSRRVGRTHAAVAEPGAAASMLLPDTKLGELDPEVHPPAATPRWTLH